MVESKSNDQRKPERPEQDHDHENRCCREHGIHVNPHRGCILR